MLPIENRQEEIGAGVNYGLWIEHNLFSILSNENTS